MNPQLQLMNNFLRDINYNNVYVLPCCNDSRKLAAKARGRGRRLQSFQKLNGMGLMRENVIKEAQRLGYSYHVAYLITRRIWNSPSNYLQKRQFVNLAASANKINKNMTSVNNDDTINRVRRIITSQETNHPTGNEFLNGTSDFYSKDDLESSMLPAGFGSSFP
jgi:hypothetical protein